jgi:hypothetical protein
MGTVNIVNPPPFTRLLKWMAPLRDELRWRRLTQFDRVNYGHSSNRVIGHAGIDRQTARQKKEGRKESNQQSHPAIFSEQGKETANPSLHF